MRVKEFIKELRYNVVVESQKDIKIANMIRSRTSCLKRIEKIKDKIKEYKSKLTPDLKEKREVRIRFSISSKEEDIEDAKVDITNLEGKIKFLKSSDVDGFICLINNSEYYYDKCMEYIEILADATMRASTREIKESYDSAKNVLWNHIAILTKDKELLQFDKD